MNPFVEEESDEEDEDWEDEDEEDAEVTVVEDHAIYYAIRENDKQRVDQMMRADPKVLAISAAKWDGTPLIYAILEAEDADWGDEMAMFIIRHECSQYWGAATQTRTTNFDYAGMTPIMAAVWAEQPAVVQALVARGAEPTEMNPKIGHTPLSLAGVRHSSAGQEILEYLLTFPAVRATIHDPFESDHGGRTSILGEACGVLRPHNTPKVIKILLDAGADPSFPGEDEGKSPLTMLEIPRDFYRRCEECPHKQAEAYARIDESEALLRASIDASVRARCLFKARFVDDAAKAIPAAAEAARKDGLSPSAQRRRALDTAPECLKGRVEEQRPLPGVVCDDAGKGCLEMQGETTSDVLEKAVTGLNDDVFEKLMEMMVPPGDLAWEGEPMGKFLKRLENEDWRLGLNIGWLA